MSSVGSVLPDVAAPTSQPSNGMLVTVTPSSSVFLPSVQATPLDSFGPAQVMPVVPVGQPVSMQPVPVTLHYVLPANVSTSSLTSRRISMQGVRRLQVGSNYTGYTSTASAISILLSVTPLGGSTTNTTGTCTASGAGTSGTCTVTFTATPGPTTLAGTLSESGNVIASFSQIQIIQPNAANTINFTANPVVNSATLQLAATSVNGGTPSNTLLTLNAKDANGNTIAGTAPYVDVNGNPISFTLNATTAQAGGSGTVTIQGSSRITTPNQTTTYAHYDGNWLDHVTFSATTSSTLPGGITSTSLSTRPYATEYAVGTQPYGLTVGIDGNLWIAEFNANTIQAVSPNGTVAVAINCPTNPTYLITGDDGKLYVSTSINGPGLFSYSITSGTFASYSVNGHSNQGAALGSTGLIWVARAPYGLLSSVSSSNQVTNYYLPNSGASTAVALGPDGNIWYDDYVNGVVGRMTQQGTTLSQFAISDTAQNTGLTIGPDGNMWLVGGSTNTIQQVTPTGLGTTCYLQSGATPLRIITGPDGYLWFTESGRNTIGRSDVNCSITEYTTTNGISNTSQPRDIVVGPDGNIWFTEFGANKVAKFVL